MFESSRRDLHNEAKTEHDGSTARLSCRRGRCSAAALLTLAKAHLPQPPFGRTHGLSPGDMTAIHNTWRRVVARAPPNGAPDGTGLRFSHLECPVTVVKSREARPFAHATATLPPPTQDRFLPLGQRPGSACAHVTHLHQYVVTSACRRPGDCTGHTEPGAHPCENI